MKDEKLSPVRMCVSCRERFKRDLLYRFQCKNSTLVLFSGEGRSFYVCESCIKNKKFVNYISKLCKISKTDAKEMIFHFSS